jgi:alpha-glucosidase
MSQFGGSVWAKDSITGQYYLHSFLSAQPDLNWRNPEVQEAMFNALRFWLDRGVDGFRVDVIWLLIKDDQFRDNPPNPAYLPTQPDINRTLSVYNSDRPEIHSLVAKMRAVLDRYRDRVLIGEIYLPIERLVKYYGDKLAGAHLPFNFALIHAAWNAKVIASLILEYEEALPPGGWPNWVLGTRSTKDCLTRGRCASKDCRNAAAHFARYADDVLRRRGRDGARGGAKRVCAGSMGNERAGLGRGPGSLAHTNAMGWIC